MNLEDLKTYLEYSKKANQIFSRHIDPIGTEFDVIKDVYEEVKTVFLKNREFEIPGIKRAWNAGIIQGALAYFRDKVKKDVMPIQFAKTDNLIIEPLYRPQIFNMTSFTISFSGLTPPAVIDLLTPGGTSGPYTLQVDKEMIILTDIITTDADPVVAEILITADGDPQRPLSTRKAFKIGEIKVYELPFPVVVDNDIRIQARVEVGSGSFTYLPIGLHAVLGAIHKGLT